MGETWAHDEFGGLILLLLAEGLGVAASRLRCLGRTIREQCENTVDFEVSQNGSTVMTFFPGSFVASGGAHRISSG